SHVRNGVRTEHIRTCCTTCIQHGNGIKGILSSAVLDKSKSRQSEAGIGGIHTVEIHVCDDRNNLQQASGVELIADNLHHSGNRIDWNYHSNAGSSDCCNWIDEAFGSISVRIDNQEDHIGTERQTGSI